MAHCWRTQTIGGVKLLDQINYIVKPDELDRMELFDNQDTRWTMEQVQEHLGCDVVFPGPYFDSHTFQPVVYCKIDGEFLCNPGYNNYGMMIADGKPQFGKIPQDTVANYVTNDVLVINGQKRAREIMTIHPDGYQRRGRAVLMQLQDDSLLFRATRDGGAEANTVLGEQAHVVQVKAKWAINYDGGRSANIITPDGSILINDYGQDHTRIMPVYIIAYLKKSKKKGDEYLKSVMLDAGHYHGCPNGNDKFCYKEDEFALDMSKRIERILKKRGIKVYQTRMGEEYVGLTERSTKANKVKDLDLFVSLHSNANPNKSCDGFGVMICGRGGNAEKTAKAILAEATQRGVKFWGSGLFVKPSFSVLRKTVAPAVLIEHAFHSNNKECQLLKSPDYRDMLARIDADGICHALGVPIEPEEKPIETPWYEDSRKRLMQAGVTDGTNPDKPTTRAEVWVMLDRMMKGGK